MAKSLLERMSPIVLDKIPKFLTNDEEEKKEKEELAKKNKVAETFLPTGGPPIDRKKRQESFDQFVREAQLTTRQIEMLTKSDLDFRESVDPTTNDKVTIIRGEITSSQGTHRVSFKRIMHTSSMFSGTAPEFFGTLDRKPLNSDQSSEMFRFYFPIAQVLVKLGEKTRSKEQNQNRLGAIEDELMGR